MRDIRKYYKIPDSPPEVYLALTNPLSIQLWTGEEAEMSTTPGSEFSLWGGSIVGKNIEFIENQKIVQQWYFGEQQEQSMVTIILHPDKNGTSAELRHINIPDTDYEDILEGWDNAYFGSLIDFFEN